MVAPAAAEGRLMESDCLDYRLLPGQNPLFARFLHQPASVQEWYGEEVDPEGLQAHARKILASGRDYPREALADLLRDYNERLDAGPATMKAIQDLGQPDSVAVVTGQQVGLFGGPALSVYKAITAVKLARLLRDSGFRAVPVFWLASDDSDFDEARSTTFVAEDASLLEVTYPRDPTMGHRPVGSVKLRRVKRLLDQLESQLGRGEFRSFTLDLLRETYLPGRTFSEAFGAWLSVLFREQGLVVFDALMPGFKQHLRAALKIAISRRDHIVGLLNERNQALQRAGFVPQVTIPEDETLLFRLDRAKRIKLEYRQGGFQAKERNGARVDTNKMLSEVDARPESFAPNVLLRPILQDHLFPTVAYVGGPAEIAYFAQLRAIAPEWGLDPTVVPRSGATIVDSKAARLLGKYGLRETDIIGSDLQATLARLVSETSARDVLAEFDRLESAIRTHADTLEAVLPRFDPTVAAFLAGAERKMLYQAGRVRNRFINNYARITTDIQRHCLFLHNSLYPKQHLQERLLNFNHFLVYQGPSLVDRVSDLLHPFCKGHHVLRLS